MIDTNLIGEKTPLHLSSDHDPLFAIHRWQPNVRIFEVREFKSIPTVPLFHPLIKRVIGTNRRERLDRHMFCYWRDLEKNLEDLQHYDDRHCLQLPSEAKNPRKSTVRQPRSKRRSIISHWENLYRSLVKHHALYNGIREPPVNCGES